MKTKIKNIISIGFCMFGTLVGAGFASGKQKTDGIKKIVKAAKRNEESAINYLKYKTEFGDIQEEPNQNIVKMQEMAMNK